jgi:hypothetical protein
MNMTLSTPFSFSFGQSSKYETRCFSWQVGVNAPGAAVSMIFLFLNSAAICQLISRSHTTDVESACIPSLALYRTGNPHATIPAFSSLYGTHMKETPSGKASPAFGADILL